MFVVYLWANYEGSWDHKYFKNKENAEYYARELRERSLANVELEEIQTED